MTQDLLDQPGSTETNQPEPSENFGWGADAQSADFNYVPLSPWAVVAIVLSLLGLTAFLGLFGIAVAAAGVVVSVAAVVRIRGERGLVRGMAPALIGLLLSLMGVGGGIASQVYHYRTEVPEGYIRVNFPNDISAHQFAMYRGGQRRLKPEVAELVDKQIFIKGFMWQTQQDTGLENFVFLKDNGECCFGGSPQPYDMMEVIMQDGQTADGHTGLLAVAGVLRADVTAGEDDAVYTLEAHLVEPARTRF